MILKALQWWWCDSVVIVEMVEEKEEDRGHIPFVKRLWVEETTIPMPMPLPGLLEEVAIAALTVDLSMSVSLWPNDLNLKFLVFLLKPLCFGDGPALFGWWKSSHGSQRGRIPAFAAD